MSYYCILTLFKIEFPLEEDAGGHRQEVVAERVVHGGDLAARLEGHQLNAARKAHSVQKLTKLFRRRPQTKRYLQ